MRRNQRDLFSRSRRVIAEKFEYRPLCPPSMDASPKGYGKWHNPNEIRRFERSVFYAAKVRNVSRLGSQFKTTRAGHAKLFTRRFSRQVSSLRPFANFRVNCESGAALIVSALRGGLPGVRVQPLPPGRAVKAHCYGSGMFKIRFFHSSASEAAQTSTRFSVVGPFEINFQNGPLTTRIIRARGCGLACARIKAWTKNTQEAWV